MTDLPPRDFRALIAYIITFSIIILVLFADILTKDGEERNIYKDKEPTDFVYRRKFTPPDW